jgi:protein-tyrosine phosphatase
LIETARDPLLSGAPNFRDIGGIPACDARLTRPGVLYRSGSLADLPAPDRQRLGDLGIRLYVDLRSATERTSHKVSWPEPAPRIREFEVLPDTRASGRSIMQGLLDDEDGTWTQNLMLQNYSSMPHALAPHARELFQELGATGGAPVVVACTAGQDRTGFVTALLLSALGVTWDCIVADYMESHRHHNPERIANYISKALGDDVGRSPSQAVLDALSPTPAYLCASFALITQDFGTVSRYLAINGVSEHIVSHLRRSYLR